MLITLGHIHWCSVGSFSNHDFLNWLCWLVMWFHLNLEEVSCCSVSNSFGRDALGSNEKHVRVQKLFPTWNFLSFQEALGAGRTISFLHGPTPS